jgi:hypothetical protein
MHVIMPNQITPGMVISSTATDSTPDWSSSATYSTGNRVLYQQYIYESLQNANTGKQPDISPTFWLRVSPSNRWAMFDTSNSTKTVAAAPLTVKVKFTNTIIDSLAFFGLSGTSLTVTIVDTQTNNTIFNQTYDLDDTIIIDWYTYFFEPYDFREDLLVLNIPPYGNTEVTVTLSSGSTNVGIGTMIAGNLITLGGTQYGVNVGIKDYSVKETNDFGDITFVRRAYSKRMSASVFVYNSDLRRVHRVLTDLRAVPAVWIGSEDSRYEPTVLYGFYKDFSTEISYPDASIMNIELEGLT